MKTRFLGLGLAAVLLVPVFAQAKEVTLSTQMNNYRGEGAYLAFYLTDSEGQYQKTLWIAGKKSKYYRHLRDWARGSGKKSAEYDGVTGASITSGSTLETTVTVDDELIDAGYQIRVDSAVEDKRDNRAEVVAPLTTEGSGKPVNGRGYIHSFTYEF